MNSFSISELQQFSGIKAHTIRMWEQRYNALKPDRSEGNTRYYDNTQLRRLLNIVSLIDTDHKVSQLCSMPDHQINKLLEEHSRKQVNSGESFDYFISQFIAAGFAYDEVFFEKLFANAVLRFGIKNTYLNVIYPLLVRIGLMWSTSSIPAAQEHFISNLIRQKFFTAIDALPPAKKSKNSWLLFLPENEFHEIGLLFANYLVRASGKKVFYLGSNVPYKSLQDAVKSTNASNLLFFLVHHDHPAETQSYVNRLSSSFKDKKIYLSGNQRLINQLKLAKNLSWIQLADQLEKELSVK